MRVRDGAISLIKSGDSNLLGKYQAVENVSEKKNYKKYNEFENLSKFGHDKLVF